MPEKISRRDFIRGSARIGFSAALGGCLLKQPSKASSYLEESELVDISVVHSSDYHESTRKAVEVLGGMEKFVPKGSKVALLPNVQRWHPGTFTKPEIVRAVIQMCKQAGAEEVNALSWLDMKNWEATGLASVLEEEGAALKLIGREEVNFKSVDIPNGVSMHDAMIMQEFFNNDVFIDMPVTKDHAGNKFTGTMKNLMGLNFPTHNRSQFHKENWKTDSNAIRHLDQCIVDLNTIIQPALCVVDATEFIITNGPMGPGKILEPQKVIAGVDRVALDAYCTTLWDIQAENIVHIKHAHDRGLGTMNLTKVAVKEIAI